MPPWPCGSLLSQSYGVGGGDFDKLVKIACWQNSLMNSAVPPPRKP